jgi:hypothetical protein
MGPAAWLVAAPCTVITPPGQTSLARSFQTAIVFGGARCGGGQEENYASEGIETNKLEEGQNNELEDHEGSEGAPGVLEVEICTFDIF